MNKVDQMWYLLLICHDFATVVIPFFRAALCTSRIEASTSPAPGIPRAFDAFSCSEGGNLITTHRGWEFEF